MIITSIIYVIADVISLLFTLIPEITFAGFEFITILDFIFNYFLRPILYIFPLFFALKLLALYLVIVKSQLIWNTFKFIYNMIRGSGA